MLVIPLRTEPKEFRRIEAVVLHNPDVANEAGESLDETDLPVCHWDETFVDQTVGELVSRVTLHDVGFGSFVGEWNGFLGELKLIKKLKLLFLIILWFDSFPGRRSVPKSMQRIVTVPSGRGIWRSMKTKKGVISGMFEVSVYAMDFFKLSKMRRPSSTPVTIEAKLSSRRIMSAACFETSSNS
jgi:hypothetical protein